MGDRELHGEIDPLGFARCAIAQPLEELQGLAMLSVPGELSGSSATSSDTG